MRLLIYTIKFFTIIRLPMVKFDQKNFRKFVIVFPLVGLFIGSIMALIVYNKEYIPTNIFIVILTIGFVSIPGGLHFDGFLDVADSYFSRAPMKRKNQILEDPRSGAFAVLSACIFFVISWGVVSEIYQSITWMHVLLIPVVSRSINSMMIVLTQASCEPGLLPTYDKKDIKMLPLSILGIIIPTILIGYVVMIPVLFSILFVRWGIKYFSGLNGDLCGCFITIAELMMLTGLVWLL